MLAFGDGGLATATSPSVARVIAFSAARRSSATIIASDASMPGPRKGLAGMLASGAPYSWM